MKDLLKLLAHVVKAFVGAFNIDKIVEDADKSKMSLNQLTGRQLNEQEQKEVSEEAGKLYEQREAMGLNTGNRQDDMDHAIMRAQNNFFFRDKVKKEREQKEQSNDIERP